MAVKLIRPTPEAEAFLSLWQSGAPYIEAHTSGSTGAPKTISLPRADMVLSARATNARFGITEASLMVCPLSTGHIAGMMMVVRAAEARCALAFEYPSNHPLAEHPAPGGRVALLPIVPSQIHGLMQSPHVAEVDSVIVGGAPMTPEQEAALTSAPFRAYATYGMTETCSHVALREAGTPLYSSVSPDITFCRDTRGCLIINALRYSFGSLVTNDVVTLQGPRAFRWLGRADNAIISGGIKILPEEVERLLAPALASVVPFYISSEPDPKWGSRVVLVTEESAPLADDEILQAARHFLPPYWVPKRVVRLPRLERTPNGKLRRLKSS